MLQRIEDEIKKHCDQCPHEKCLGSKCIAHRIKNIVCATFDSSKINIDDFFAAEDKSQMSLFDGLWGDEI